MGVLLVGAPWRDFDTSVAGSLACLGAAVSYAGGFVFVRKHLSSLQIPALSLAAAQTLAATVLQVPLTPLLGWAPPTFTGRVVVAVLALGLLGTGLAYILCFRLIADLGASRASSVNYGVRVVAVGVGVLALGEPVTWHLVAGGALVLMSMATHAGNASVYWSVVTPSPTFDGEGWRSAGGAGGCRCPPGQPHGESDRGGAEDH